jgi:hypothetical protein
MFRNDVFVPLFGRRGGDRPESLGLDELLARYGATDLALAGGDPVEAAARAHEADRLAAEILRREPADAAVWYDRGMLAKWRRDWPASVSHNRRALELIEAPAGEPAAWNLGIAATAVRDWSTARLAWDAYGVELPPGPSSNRPIRLEMGLCPLRLNPAPRFAGELPVEVDGVGGHDTEVVWGMRICPTRMQILNVPTPGSGHRYGDVVLHDGDTVGVRRFGDRELGVFNEIAVWERSTMSTLRSLVEAPEPAALDELSDVARALGCAAEDWSTTMGGDDADGWDTRRTVGIAGDVGRVHDVLDRWAAADTARSFDAVEVVLA